MEKSKVMKTTADEQSKLEAFKAVQLEAEQTPKVKGGNGEGEGEGEEGDANGGVGEVDIIDL